MDGLTLLYTIWPDAESAETAGRRLINEGLAACVNILTPVRSIHRWKGQVVTADETPMLVKTTQAAAAAAAARLAGLHPYEVPAIIDLGVAADGTSAAFAAWVASEVAAPVAG